jgi:hypothetical protein
MLYKIHGGMVTISFTLSIAVTAYSSNYLSVKIPLPIAADVSVGFGWYSVFNYTPNSAAYAIGEASILYTAPTFLQLTVANQTSTGTAFIHGEITYKI